jgi:hypothetical protein
MGPASVFSMNKKRFFLWIIDDFSKYAWMSSLAQK